MQETLVQFLGQEDPLDKGQATHSSILAWRIPRGLQRVGHDLVTFTSLEPIGGKQYNWWKACFNISQMNEMNIETQAAIRRDKLED